MAVQPGDGERRRLAIAGTRRAPELALTGAFGRVGGTGKGWAIPERAGVLMDDDREAEAGGI